MTLTLRKIQDAHAEWMQERFPGRQPFYHLLGAQGELGELTQAYLKALEANAPADRRELAEEAADVCIFLMGFCSDMGIDLEHAIKWKWAELKVRPK